MRARLLARAVILAAALCVPSAAIAQSPKASAMPLPPGMTPAIMKMMMTPGPAHPAGIPADAQPWGGCIPSMGYHYANPKNVPFGPVYGWYNGKVTFTEIMVSKADFAAGKDWNDQLKPLPGHQIDHVDIWFEPHGHPGYQVPHYDIHAWYVPRSEYMKYCGNTSGKKPVFI